MAGGTTTGRLSGSLGKGSSSGKAGFKVPKAAPASKTQVHRPPEPKWQVAAYRFKPKKELTQDQLKAARKLFFDIDIDMSGSIDAEELGVMLRTLGQNPTEDELCQLIDLVDDGDRDGKIQYREFLQLYALGVNNQGKSSRDEADNVCLAALAFAGGDDATHQSKGVRPDGVPKQALVDMLSAQFDLELGDYIEGMIGQANNGEISRDQVADFLTLPVQ